MHGTPWSSNFGRRMRVKNFNDPLANRFAIDALAVAPRARPDPGLPRPGPRMVAESRFAPRGFQG